MEILGRINEEVDCCLRSINFKSWKIANYFNYSRNSQMTVEILHEFSRILQEFWQEPQILSNLTTDLVSLGF